MPMIYTGKFDPLAFIADFSKTSSGLAKLTAKAPKNLSNVVTNEKVQVYRWSDENGVMQFSNTPPPTGTNAEQIVLDPNSNLLQAVKIPEKKEEPKQVAKTESTNPYSVKGMKKVMDDARGVEKMLQQRHEEQQKMMNNL